LNRDASRWNDEIGVKPRNRQVFSTFFSQHILGVFCFMYLNYSGKWRLIDWRKVVFNSGSVIPQGLSKTLFSLIKNQTTNHPHRKKRKQGNSYLIWITGSVFYISLSTSTPTSEAPLIFFFLYTTLIKIQRMCFGKYNYFFNCSSRVLVQQREEEFTGQLCYIVFGEFCYSLVASSTLQN
jgi:hypothetical protein